jgi:hypothetical protein
MKLKYSFLDKEYLVLFKNIFEALNFQNFANCHELKGFRVFVSFLAEKKL